MSNAALDKMDEIFGNPDNFNPENMDSLIQETLQFFNALKHKLESQDPKEREEALNLATLLKTKLEEQAVKLCETAGMDPQSLESYISDPSHFSQDEWQVMEKAKTDLDSYKQEITQTDPTKSLKRKPKSVKEWLIT